MLFNKNAEDILKKTETFFDIHDDKIELRDAIKLLVKKTIRINTAETDQITHHFNQLKFGAEIFIF